MELYEVKNMYRNDGSVYAPLDLYSAYIGDHRGDEKKLNELAFIAADYAHTDALKLLFEAGVSPSVTDDYAFTLLHHLARQNESKYFIKPAGAVAETTAFLLDNKVSALRKDENESMTCYHYAARNGLAEMVETMAARGTKLNMTDRDGNTGIHIACQYIKYAISDVNYKEKDLENARERYEETVAQQKGYGKSDEEIAEYLKKWTTIFPEQAQQKYDAAIQLVEDYFCTVKAFAEGGVDIDEKNSYGQAALDIAINSDAKKIAAYLSGTLTDESDEASISAGGMTLHQAAEKGDAEAIKAIVNTGADVNGLKDGDEYHYGGCTALAIAVAHLQDGAAEALLSCGADPSFKDGSGRAAIAYLFTRFNGAFDEKKIKKIIKDMVSAGFSANETVDDDGNTLLVLACKSSRGTGYNNHSMKGDVIGEMLKLNPDINLANRFGETALMHTCADDFDMMENVQLTLLEQGADASPADQNGDTALHYAARNYDKNGAKILCDMLLEFGADANAVNNAGQTALDIATEKDNEPLVKLLLSKM